MENGNEQKRRILGLHVRPEADFGDLLNTVLICTAAIGGFISYGAEAAKRDSTMAQIKIDLVAETATRDRSFSELRGELQRVTEAVNATNVNVAVLKERSDQHERGK